MLRIERVLAPNPGVYTLDGTNTWIVGADPSVVIDPGPDDPAHLDEVMATAGRIAAVLLTHDHPDHAPGAPVLAAKAGAPLYAYRLPGAERLRDGTVVEAGTTRIVALHTPGHTSDHVAFHVPSEAALFTGDAVLGRGTSFIDPPDGDLTKYLASLERMLELHAHTIYPGHGPIVFHADRKLHEYLDHRRDRERQVLDELAGGPRTAGALAERIYAGHPSEVLPLAARSVLAHLRKLESEGRVLHDGHGDAAVWLLLAEPKACARCGRPVRGRARYCGSCSLILLQEGSGEPTT